MKKIFALIFTAVMIFSMSITAFAAKGNVTYNGKSREFIFSPGSDYSPTDLFPEFKDVMPGDRLTQKITVKNDASKEVKVKIYIRSLGAQEESVDFLSQLGLRVKKSEKNKMGYMFDAAASDSADLTEWNYLGTLYSGGEVNLDVILDVPVELDNDYQKQVGYLDWEFMIEEFPVEESDPDAPKTWDNSKTEIWFSVMLGSAVVIFIFLFWKRKEKKDEKSAPQN